jgi:uncharacterized protein
MSLSFNLRHLEKRNLRLEGEVPASELDLVGIDELIEITKPVVYDLAVERLSDSILVQGSLRCTLTCQCARCLRSFTRDLDLPDWICDLPLEGEDRVAVNNDSIDLTPYVREDILLAFPQHPLCEPDCQGLPEAIRHVSESTSVEEQAREISSAWAELNRLKL